jgi:hypothetical protein
LLEVADGVTLATLHDCDADPVSDKVFLQDEVYAWAR